jgi:hypothetical protein
VSWVNNDNVHQSSEVVFGDKDIHLLLGVAKEKVGDFPLNMCSTLQSNNCEYVEVCHGLVYIHSHKVCTHEPFTKACKVRRGKELNLDFP